MHVARKITWTLFVAQALSSTGFLATGTINSIVAADLSGRPEWAGAPSAVFQLGIAVASMLLGYAMDRVGRRNALAAAFAIGGVGSAIAAWAVVTNSLFGFLSGLALMGPAGAAAGLSRFTAAEVHPPAERGRAIAHVVVGATVATAIWPLLSVSLAPWLGRSGISDLTWPYLVNMALLIVTSFVAIIFLRPDPGEIARRLAAESRPEDASGRIDSGASLMTILRRPGAIVAIGSMVFGHAVMVMVMVITSLHMRNHSHAVPAISLTISGHVLGMYAFSILSGRLADRFGRAPVIIAGAVILMLACVIASLSPAFVPITFGLFLLGFGWNFCFVGGSSLLADQLAPDERGRTQGFNDLLMGLVAASGSIISGFVFTAVGYSTMVTMFAGISLAPLALAVWWHLTRAGQPQTI